MAARICPNFSRLPGTANSCTRLTAAGMPMTRPIVMTYALGAFPRWRRRASGAVDPELADLCRQHWRKSRESSPAANREPATPTR